jgi:cysteine synthase B
VSGTSRFLRSKNADVKVIAVQPSQGHDVPGLRNISQLKVAKLFDPGLVDEVLEIDFRLAYTRALGLCREEGLLAGPSSGLLLEGALQLASRNLDGLGVMIFPDNIFKYTSNMIKHIPDLAAGLEP